MVWTTFSSLSVFLFLFLLEAMSNNFTKRMNTIDVFSVVSFSWDNVSVLSRLFSDYWAPMIIAPQPQTAGISTFSVIVAISGFLKKWIYLYYFVYTRTQMQKCVKFRRCWIFWRWSSSQLCRLDTLQKQWAFLTSEPSSIPKLPIFWKLLTATNVPETPLFIYNSQDER